MLDSGWLDDGYGGGSVCDSSGRTVPVSIWGFAKAGRLVGEGAM